MGSHRAVALLPPSPPPTDDERVGRAGLSAARHYHPGVCHWCLALPPDYRQPLTPPLMRCSQCQLIVYCSRRCQKKDWPKHRDLCRANKVLDGRSVFSRAKEEVAGGGSWDDYRDVLLLAASVNLKHKLLLYEREIFQFPRVCEVCKDSSQASLACCPRCYSVFYCGSEHRDQDEERHESQCSNYLLLLECDRVESLDGIQDLPFPVQVDEVYMNLPVKLMTLVRPQLEKDSASPLDPKIVTMITERISYPLSLLYALQNIGIGSENTALHDIRELTVHIVGATSYTELLGVIRWEYMMHRLPLLKLLHIVFIGPDIFADHENCEEIIPDNHVLDDSCKTMCDDCHRKQRRIVYEMASMCYDEFSSSHYYGSADVIVAYNCGFHERSGQDRDTWSSSFPLLLKHSCTPLVFTSYTEDEAKRDLAALQEAGPLKVVMDSHVNPYHSLRPYRDHDAKAAQPIYFWNYYITCVRGVSS